MGSTVSDMVAHARTQVRNISAAEVSEALEAGPVTLVDLRGPGEIEREGRVPGALRVPRGVHGGER
ncbi:hypothetical protein AGRA3207_003972 [Actinomadura graeca]|uniref:Rhodanese-like domain-containing protein n=1 Tax=Actinomadura graeca TaxID=2750812 RepID=A0ABX8QVU5_9ACTN|nr:hypothetical protein [Actinomadura graeca]QXJ22895.1 hypothetical protein AGRA3207_003972 [Actinomadura graeca]